MDVWGKKLETLTVSEKAPAFAAREAASETSYAAIKEREREKSRGRERES